MPENIPLNQIRFLAALGHPEFIKNLEQFNPGVVALQLNLETIQFWQRDFQWREWKKHLRAGGRVICVKTAVAALSLAKNALADEAQGLAVFEEASTTIEQWLCLQNGENRIRVRRLDETLKIFDSNHTEKYSYQARSAINALMQVLAIIEQTDFSRWWRYSLWWTYLALSGFDFDLDEFHRSRMLESIRQSVFDYCKVTPTNRCP